MYRTEKVRTITFWDFVADIGLWNTIRSLFNELLAALLR